MGPKNFKIGEIMTTAAARTAVQAFICCRLNYCNSLLYGMSDGLFRKIQSIQNASACLVTGNRRCDHITPVLRQLHWLSVFSMSWLQGCMSGAPVASRSDTCIPGWWRPTRDGHWSPSSVFSCRQDMLRSSDTTVLPIEALVWQARVCGRVCHRTYDKTWASRVSSINWKHLCLGIRQPRRIVTVAIVRLRNTLTYLLTYLDIGGRKIFSQPLPQITDLGCS